MLPHWSAMRQGCTAVARSKHSGWYVHSAPQVAYGVVDWSFEVGADLSHALAPTLSAQAHRVSPNLR